MSSPHRKQVRQYNRETCYFCGSEGPIESHHIVPRRHDGPDEDWNLVDLCPTCHQRLERLYNDNVWEVVDVNREEQTTPTKTYTVDEGVEAVELIATELQNVDEMLYPTGEDIIQGLIINDVPEEFAEFHLRNAIDEESIVAIDRTESVKSGTYRSTGSNIDKYEPIVNYALPTEQCLVCENRVVLVETNSDGEPICNTCGHSRREQAYKAANPSEQPEPDTKFDSKEENTKEIKRIIEEVDEESPGRHGANTDIVKKRANQVGFSSSSTQKILDRLKHVGDAYLPEENIIKLV